MNTVDSNAKVKLLGKISKVMPGSEYLVEIEMGGAAHEVIGYISGKMRKNYIKLAKGDYVEVEMTPYDISKCRIVYRHKSKPNSITDHNIIENQNESQS